MLRQLTEYEVQQWSSHKEAIDQCLSKSTITNMIEVGSGVFSTPIYKDYVKKLIFIETDPKWYEYMVQNHSYPNVEYVFKPRDEIAPFLIQQLNDQLIDLVFVDHSVENTNINHRAYIANIAALHNTKYIVIHDLCETILKDVYLTKKYTFYINQQSINPSLIMERK